MNESHKTGKLKNRLNRCNKQLSNKDITASQRTSLVQRISELRLTLKIKD